MRISMADSAFEPKTRAKRPLWSLVNENACCKLARDCQNQSKLLRQWIKWLKRFSLICSLATAGIAAGTATTTLLLPTSKFDEFRDGLSTFLYISSGIVSLPKLLTIPERISKSATAIGQFDALANRLHHEISVMVAADREDVAVFMDDSYHAFKNILGSVSMPEIFTSINGLDDNEAHQVSVTSQEGHQSTAAGLHRALLEDPSCIWKANDDVALDHLS